MKLITRTILIPHIFQGNFRTRFQMHEHAGKLRDFTLFYCLCMCFTLFLSSYLPQNKWPQYMAIWLFGFSMWFSDFKITWLKTRQGCPKGLQQSLCDQPTQTGPSPQPHRYIKVLVPNFKIRMGFGGMGCEVHIQRTTAFYPLNIIEGAGFTESPLLELLPLGITPRSRVGN